VEEDTDPASHLDKKYHVQVGRVTGDDRLARIAGGANVGGKISERRGFAGGKQNSWLKLRWTKENRQITPCAQALVRRCCG
jgi:23S rRNA pseudouridine2605 synthase